MSNPVEEARAAEFRRKLLAQYQWRVLMNKLLRGDKTARQQLDQDWQPLRRLPNE